MKFKLLYIEAFNQMEAALENIASQAASPDLLEELDPDVQRMWLNKISLTLRVHGRQAARRMWAFSPLPQVGTSSSVGTNPPNPELLAKECLEHLLTLAEIKEENRNWLRKQGILIRPANWEGFVAISTNHPRLKTHFQESDFANCWAPTLLGLPGAKKHPGSVHFNLTTRAILIPWRYFNKH